MIRGPVPLLSRVRSEPENFSSFVRLTSVRRTSDINANQGLTSISGGSCTAQRVNYSQALCGPLRWVREEPENFSSFVRLTSVRRTSDINANQGLTSTSGGSCTAQRVNYSQARSGPYLLVPSNRRGRRTSSKRRTAPGPGRAKAPARTTEVPGSYRRRQGPWTGIHGTS